MPTQIKSIGALFAPVAQGPGEVVFSFNDDFGRFSIHGSTDPAGIVASHKQPTEVPYTVNLAAGDVLHLRGRGTATVSGTTLL